MQTCCEGAMDVGADVEYVNLYSYDFKGCMSCFACHLKKNKDNPLCFWKALYAYDTKQFKQYFAYLNNMFDPELKEQSNKTQFPKDCKKAYELGQRLVRE